MYNPISRPPAPQAAVSALREREAALTTVGLMEEDLERKKRALVALEAAGTLGGAANEPPG